MEQKEKLILDLDKLRHPEPLPADQFFYAEEMNTVLGFLKTFSDTSASFRSSPTNITTVTYHQAISIVGNRGAGKTTFLKSLPNLLSNHKELGKRVAFLDIIDPSVMEEGNLFLTTVITHILGYTELHLENKTRSPALKAELDEAKRELTLKFKVLLDGGIHSSWRKLDEELLAAQLTYHAKSGLTMSEAVHKFLELTTHILGVDILVLPIDDCDTLFESGFDVLEALRKYLHSPYLVPLVTGNMELFEVVLLNHFYKQARCLPKESSRYKNLEHEMEVLANQYLAKILKPVYRISLNPMVDHWRGTRPDRPCHIQLRNGIVPVFSLFNEFIEAVLGRLPLLQSNAALQPQTIPFASLLPRNNRLLISILDGMKTYLTHFRNGLNDPSVDPDSKYRAHFFRHHFSTFLQNYWYYTHSFDLSADKLMHFYGVGGESSLTLLMLANWNLDHRLFAQSGTYTDKKDSVSQRGIISSLLNMVYSRVIWDNPSRILPFMLLPCEVPRGMAHWLNDQRNANQFVNAIGLDNQENLVSFMADYGELIKEKSALVYTKESPASDFSHLAEIRGKDGAWLLNFYRYLGIAGEIHTYMHRSSDSRKYRTQELVALFQIFSYQELPENGLEKLSEAYIKWFQVIKDRSIVNHYRPSSRILATAMQRFHKTTLTFSPGDQEIKLEKAVSNLAVSLFVEETLARAHPTSDKVPKKRQPPKLTQSPSQELIKRFKALDAEFTQPRIIETLWLTDILITNPLIRLCLDSNFRKIAWL